MLETRLGKGKKSIPALVFDDERSLAWHLAEKIAGEIQAAENTGLQFLLGCPCGRSPLKTYQMLAKLSADRQFDLSNLVLVMMDEYAVKTSDAFVYCPENAHYSCRRFARQEIFELINNGLPLKKQIRTENMWFPDPANPAEHDSRVEKAGGVDIFIAAVGASDYHVAFNPPGSPMDSESRIIKLNGKTREDNLSTFPNFLNLSEVPEYGVSVGLKTILHSQNIALIVNGEHKRGAAKALHSLDGFDPCVPASVVYESQNAVAYFDRVAAKGVII